MDLSLGLNERLTDLLMTAAISEDNYTQFMKEVRTITGRLESEENYVVSTLNLLSTLYMYFCSHKNWK